MHQLDSHMCISWQTLIWEITSSTIWLWAYFHDYPITKMCHWDEHFQFILLWTCHLHEQHKFALRQKKNCYEFLYHMWFLGQNLILPIYGYMDVIYTSELLHHHLLGWVLNEDWEIILITSSSMVKYHIVVGSILMTRLEVYI